MKETGILFTPENIRKIAVTKTKWQTRRVITPQPQAPGELTSGDGNWRVLMRNGMTKVFNWERDCPFGGVGDRLYIKEGIIRHASIPQLVGYYMDGCRATESWMERRTAMFMPKWAARYWLEITDVRVQRVQDISEEDAKAEGASKFPVPTFADSTYGQGFERLWDSINRKRHPWSSNPFCWCLSFQLIN
jgi:hypothetical protein